MQTLRSSAGNLLQRGVVEQLCTSAACEALLISQTARLTDSIAALRLLASSPVSSAARAALQSTSSSARACFSSSQLPAQTQSQLRHGAPWSSAFPAFSPRQLGSVCYSTRASQQGSSRIRHAEMQQKKSGEQGLYIIAFVVAMVGVTYASVPLYRMFCQATGYGGTVQQGQTVEEKLRKQAASKDELLAKAADERELTVSFNADVSDGLPWKFVPCQRSVTLRAGQSTLVFYNAQNQGDKSITGVSTYNVAPQQAGQYFNKIQCFCFEEQRLRAHENVDMPVFFYIDPEFALDPYMKNINHLTLSYTFFKVDDDDAAHDEDDDGPTVVKTHECVEQQA